MTKQKKTITGQILDYISSHPYQVAFTSGALISALLVGVLTGTGVLPLGLGLTAFILGGGVAPAVLTSAISVAITTAVIPAVAALSTAVVYLFNKLYDLFSRKSAHGSKTASAELSKQEPSSANSESQTYQPAHISQALRSNVATLFNDALDNDEVALSSSTLAQVDGTTQLKPAASATVQETLAHQLHILRGAIGSYSMADASDTDGKTPMGTHVPNSLSISNAQTHSAVGTGFSIASTNALNRAQEAMTRAHAPQLLFDATVLRARKGSLNKSAVKPSQVTDANLGPFGSTASIATFLLQAATHGQTANCADASDKGGWSLDESNAVSLGLFGKPPVKTGAPAVPVVPGKENLGQNTHKAGGKRLVPEASLEQTNKPRLDKRPVRPLPPIPGPKKSNPNQNTGSVVQRRIDFFTKCAGMKGGSYDTDRSLLAQVR